MYDHSRPTEIPAWEWGIIKFILGTATATIIGWFITTSLNAKLPNSFTDAKPESRSVDSKIAAPAVEPKAETPQHVEAAVVKVLKPLVETVGKVNDKVDCLDGRLNDLVKKTDGTSKRLEKLEKEPVVKEPPTPPVEKPETVPKAEPTPHQSAKPEVPVYMRVKAVTPCGYPVNLILPTNGDQVRCLCPRSGGTYYAKLVRADPPTVSTRSTRFP